MNNRRSTCFRIEEVKAKGSEACFLDAAEAFDLARSHIENYENGETSDSETTAVAGICKRNAVVSRILSSGKKTDVSLEYFWVPGNDFFLVYLPVIKVFSAACFCGLFFKDLYSWFLLIIKLTLISVENRFRFQEFCDSLPFAQTQLILHSICVMCSFFQFLKMLLKMSLCVMQVIELGLKILFLTDFSVS